MLEDDNNVPSDIEILTESEVMEEPETADKCLNCRSLIAQKEVAEKALQNCKVEVEEVRLRNKQLELENKELKERLFNYENFLRDDKNFKSATGLTRERLDILCKFLDSGEEGD